MAVLATVEANRYQVEVFRGQSKDVKLYHSRSDLENAVNGEVTADELVDA